MGQKIVGKLIQNMFLGPFIFRCEIMPRPTYVWLLWTPFVGLNWSKNSGKIDTKYVSGAIHFSLRNNAWAHFDL